MYHALVERVSRRNVERVNDHDHEPLLAACRPDLHHRFGGDHALRGEWHDVDALRRWFHRLGRLCPTLRLTVTDVWVEGLPDGSTYANHGVHVVRLRWMRVVSIDADEDSQAVERALALFAAHGVEEASAAPTTSWGGGRRVCDQRGRG